MVNGWLLVILNNPLAKYGTNLSKLLYDPSVSYIVLHVNVLYCTAFSDNIAFQSGYKNDTMN